MTPLFVRTFFRKWFCFGAIATAAMFFAAPLAAQEPPVASADELADDAPLAGPPVAVLNVASVERVLEDVDYLFGSVDRGDMSDVVDGLLGNLGDLKGLERGKPFGAMLFLKPALVPQPVPVGYLPVADIGALTKTVELGPVTTKKITDDSYEIIGRRGTLYARLIGGYAFVASEEEVLDRELPDPVTEFAALTTRYDVAVDVHPENVPPGMRDLFLGLVRTQMQANLQQRDDESNAAHALRKSQGMSNLRMVEAFLKETRSITLGLDTSPQNRKAVLELVIEAVPGTLYLETLQGLAEEPSRFAPLLNDDLPLSFSINSRIDDHGHQLLTELFDLGKNQVARLLTRLNRGETGAPEPAGDPPAAESVVDPAASAVADKIFGPLKQTVDERNLDLFAQFRGDVERKFVMIAGAEVLGAAGMESAVRELIDRARAANPDGEDAFDVQYDAGQAGGVSLHKLTGRKIRESERRMYGDEFAVYFGFDSNAIWIAIGGPQAVTELDTAIGRIEEAGPVERNQTAAPFQIVVTANRWVGIGDNKANSEMAREAFSEGGDSLRIDFKPTEKGGRLRVEIEEGFIRLLGLGVARRYDESQL